jgi:hypothetical protein
MNKMQTMTRTVLAVLAMSVLSLATGCSGGGSTSGGVLDPGSGDILGSGTVIEEMRSVAGIRGFDMGSEGTVYVQQGASELLLIRAEDNLLSYIDTVIHNGRLEIRTRAGYDIQPTRSIEYHLTLSSMEYAALTGAGDITGTFPAAGRLDVVLEGVGDIDLAGLNLDELNVDSSGVGDVDLSGRVDRQTVYLNGTGNYNAANLASREAEVTLFGIGSATVRVSDRLDASINSSGSVRYYGDPIVSRSGNGSGDVVRLGS